MISDDLLDVVAPLLDPRRPLLAEVETRARWLLLDTVGCAIAGGRSPAVRSWLDRHHLSSDPFGTADHHAADPSAAAALAMAACWDEACEGHAGAHGRPGVAALSAIWPFVLDLSLGEFLRAAVVGYEVGARMGAALRIAPGMHVDANWPSLAAAAAAACALGLDADRVVTAVGIAACQLPASLYRPVDTGDSARNTYLGHAALLGRMAADASAVGITAPADAVESYARVVYGRPAVTVPDGMAPDGMAPDGMAPDGMAPDGMAPDGMAPDGMGGFEILSGYFKEYAAVRHVHYAARGGLALRGEVPPKAIRSIELWAYPEAITYCGIRNPRTPLQAQFSLSFGIAAMLRWGRLDPAVYRSPDFEDPLLRSLERAVEIHEEPDWVGQRAARVRVVCSDGQTAETTISAVRGDASMPWSDVTLTEKFLTYCSGSLSPQRAEALAEHILRAPLDANVFPPA